ncbi:unnamed protein product [Rotaria magnacalcarata]|uniref:Uncharacterized protein n=1 Tax=Rotaria magnacalcarata TaxID=392030 RepID=A0A817AIA9_9BILA|nr:unnamed protein product [Rotaria magnacalcarata]CAF2266701.1 unnamed protein product [Rotaria magnacalcarata]CAF3877716.1 unnamed protein product [Rotaria magnacalcarata]
MALPPYAANNKYVINDARSDIKWRHGRPNYSKTIALYIQEKLAKHTPDSMEEIVENIVKNWEVEVSHKLDPRQWETVDVDNYCFSCNGLSKFTADDLVRLGTYSVLIGKTAYCNASMMTLSESQMAFMRAFGEGFAWELIELYSGPPNVTFKWRHFGRMTGYFSCPSFSGYTYKAEPTNKMVNIYGICKATVSSDLKIQDLQVFFDINQLFAQFTELCPLAPFANIPISLNPSAANQMKESVVDDTSSYADQSTLAVKPEQSTLNQQSTTCAII